MVQSKPEVVEAILACLLSNPSFGDEQVRRSAPNLETMVGEVRWFRRCIYRVIRLLEEGAIHWKIPRQRLYANTMRKRGKREMELITAVTWAVMRHPNLQEHDALETAGVEKTGDAKGYAFEVRPIFQKVKDFSLEKRKRYRNSLYEQMCLSVGKKHSQNWKNKLEAQIATLKGLRA